MRHRLRWLGRWAALAVVVGAGAPTAFAATLSVSPANATAPPGGSVSPSPLQIVFQGDGVTVGFDARLDFDPAQLTASSVIGINGGGCSLNAGIGRISVVHVDIGNNPLPPGPTAYCQFALNAAPSAIGSLALDLNSGNFADAQGGNAPGPHTLNDGTVSIAVNQQANLSSVPASGTTLTLPGGRLGSVVSTTLDIRATGGSGGAFASLNCTTAGGLQILAGPASQTVVGAAAPVDLTVGQTLDSAPRSDGRLDCVVDDAAGNRQWTFPVVAPAGTAAVAPAPVASLGDVERIRAGDGFSCALLRDGGAACWGGNDRGQLGIGLRSSRLTAERVLGLAEGVFDLATSVAAVGGSGAHACAGSFDGGVKCWGAGDAGQLAAGTDDRLRPAEVLGAEGDYEQVAVGSGFSCALDFDGSVLCWGDNGRGQLGRGVLGGSRLAVAAVSGLPGSIQQIATGGDFACAHDGNTALCWGSNGFAALGNGGGVDRELPVAVSGLTGGLRSLAAGADHACVLTQANEVFCWGRNTDGQIGDGTLTQRSSPRRVSGLGSSLRTISAGRAHSCALSDDGGVACWGANGEGQLGDGSRIQRSRPVAVAGLPGPAIGIAAGGDHSCALLSDREVVCWGGNASGQIGDGSSVARRLSPQRVLFHAAGRTVDPAAPADVDAATLAPSTDAGGRYVVFQSRASNLGATGDKHWAGWVGKGSGEFAVYRADTLSGAIERVSVDQDGIQGPGDAVEPSVSADGELVMFVAPQTAMRKLWGESAKARAQRLKGGGTGLFLRNILTGTTHPVPGAAPPLLGALPRIAPAGEGVVFSQPGEAGRMQVFLAPITLAPNPAEPLNPLRIPGAAVCISCKTFDANGQPTSVDASGESRNAVISADGRSLVWETTSRNLLATPATCTDRAASATDLVFRNILTGVTRQVGGPTGSSQCGALDAGASKPRIDFSGLNLVFESTQPLETRSGVQRREAWYLNIVTGQRTPLSLSLDAAVANEDSNSPVISGDGQTVAFISRASNLDPESVDANGRIDLFVRSLRDQTLRRLSKSLTGEESDGDAERPFLDYNGSRLVFDSNATNLIEGASGEQNVYLRGNPLALERLFGNGFD